MDSAAAAAAASAASASAASASASAASASETAGAVDPARRSLSRELGSQSYVFSIRPIVENHPDPESLLLGRDKHGKTPLLEAIEDHSPPDVIRYLVRRCPGALRLRTSDDTSPLPLHFALSQLSCWTPYSEPGQNVDWTPNEHYEVIRLLVRRFPPALNVRTATGELPLHLALTTNYVRGPLDEDFVRLLVKAFPGALRERGEGGMLPLHYAVEHCRDDVSLETVKRMVEVFPGALQVRDDRGRLPLHAASGSSLLPRLTYLVEKYPQAIRSKTHQGDLPLHIILSWIGFRGSGLREILYILHQWPESAHMPGAKGNLPLHLAVQHSLYRDLVPVLLKQHPDALRARNDEGNLPLHVAAPVGYENAVQAFLEACPESARVRNKAGQLPVHVAALANSPQLLPLLGHWPDSAHERDGDGRLPLHSIVESNWSDEFLEHVRYHARHAPQTLLVADNNGRLALHLAVAKSTSLSLVRVLVDNQPDSLQVRDLDGRLPVHAAASASCFMNVQVAKFLVRQWLGALQEPDNRGNWPLHAALSGLARSETVRFLVEECPPSLQKRNNDGMLPLHLALTFLKDSLLAYAGREWWRQGSQVDWFRKASEKTWVEIDDTPVGTLRWLAEQCPESLQAAGRLPLHLAAVLDPTLIPLLPLVRFFVETSPGAASARDGDGFLPFQAAAAADAPLDVVYYLARVRPDRWFPCVSHRGALQDDDDDPTSPPRQKRARTG